MTGRDGRLGFLRGHALAALAGLAVAAACLGAAAIGSLPWLVLGHGLMLAAGLLTGSFTVARHGQAVSRFLPALVLGILLRMLLVLGGAAPLAASGQPAFWSYLAGLAAAFVPMQLHEIRVLQARTA